MGLDISALVAPLSDEQPSGPDMYGDANRQQIELAFDRSISDGSAPEVSASQWQDAIDLILAQCEQTRDLWLPVYLLRGAAQSGQFDLAVDAARFLAELIEVRWADVHPQLEDLGFIGRKTPCESLTRIGDFLGPLERMPLVIHPRLGSFSGADFERFREQGPKAAGFAEFRMALDGIGADGLSEAIAGLDAIDGALRKVDAVLTANADGDTATNFKPAYDLLGKMRRAVASNLPGDGAATAADAPAGTAFAAAAPSADGPGAPAYSGAINSRDDVARAIDAICAYYARFEPASPVPFVLRRARDWISLDFMAVLEDIAPGGLEEAAKVLKTQRAAASGSDGWGDNGSASSGSDDWSSGDESADDGWN